jgi:hypothetical protein
MPGATTANQTQQTARATAPFLFWGPPEYPERDPDPVPMRVRPAACPTPPDGPELTLH